MNRPRLPKLMKDETHMSFIAKVRPLKGSSDEEESGSRMNFSVKAPLSESLAIAFNAYNQQLLPFFWFPSNNQPSVLIFMDKVLLFYSFHKPDFSFT